MSSRDLHARRLRDRVSAPARASLAFLRSRGRCEACPSVPPIAGRAAAVPVTAVSQRCWGRAGPRLEAIPVCSRIFIRYPPRRAHAALKDEPDRNNPAGLGKSQTAIGADDGGLETSATILATFSGSSFRAK